LNLFMQPSIMSVQINQWPATATSKHDEQVLLPNFAVFYPPTPIFAANFRTA